MERDRLIAEGHDFLLVLGEPIGASVQEASALDLAAAAAALFTAAAGVDWRAYHVGGNARPITLPSYPFERRRHWLDADQIRTAATLLPEPP